MIQLDVIIEPMKALGLDQMVKVERWQQEQEMMKAVGK